jgi:glycine/D-amino acid oxidase-like deaminating enzyme
VNERYDAIIIGTGIIGAAVAFELAKLGYSTINVDKLPAAGYGSTSNTCAIVRASYSTWDGVAMAYEGFSYWNDWENYIGVPDEAGFAKYINCGTLQLKSQGDEHWRKTVALYDAVGVSCEEWGMDKVRDRLPLLSSGSFYPPKRPEDDAFWDEPESELLGAIYTSESGYVSDPQLASRNLATAAEALGSRFRYNAEVTEVRRSDGSVTGITLASGEQIDAPVVVNVAGPHSFVINEMAGVVDQMNIKTRALRHEVHHVPAPADYDVVELGMHVSDADIGTYFRPETGNNILVGSEDPECDPKVWVEDPDVFDTTVSRDAWDAQVLRLARRIPELPVPSQPKGVVDLYDVSDDWIPIYDRSSLDGFYMAIGTSGNQFKNAPVAGYCMAALIDAVEHGRDHDNDPVLVEQRYKEMTLDMGFYSRNREINPESSFSVNG